MKLIQGTHKASKYGPEDFISNMPDNVVTDIMDRLPLQDAVRTSILSRNWRFKWSTLSQLVFDEEFFYYVMKRESYKDYERIISRLLLHHKGAITKFVLCLPEDYDIAHWTLLLSRKGVKDLTIFKRIGEPLKLPTHLFSCLELKHLSLDNCCFDPPASFHGFPNLLRLDLHDVEIESGKFCEFFTPSPILEILNMNFPYSPSKVKLVEIAKLTNLKILTLFWCNHDNTMITSSSSIFELMDFLPKLQELNLDFHELTSFTVDGARKRSLTTFHCLKTFKLSSTEIDSGIMISFAFEIVRSSPNLHTFEISTSDWSSTEYGAIKRSPTTFPCLNTLKLLYIDLGVGIMMSFAFELISSFPNLQTLEITPCYLDVDPTDVICFPKVDSNTLEMLQLRTVVLRELRGSENEVCLIIYILACSPFLKEIVIHDLALWSDEKLMFATKLLELHRASTVAKISLC